MKEGWEYKKLGEVCEKITDGSHNPPKGVACSDNKMLSSQNVRNGYLDLTSIRYLSDEDFQTENKRTNAKQGDVLLTIVGTIGRTCVLTGKEGNITFQRSVAVLKPSEVINSYYLMYCLWSKTESLNKEAQGAAQKGIYLKQLSNVVIAYPSLSEQKNIVDYLDSAFAKIDAMKANAEKALNEAKALFQASLKEMLEPKEGWEEKKLKEICETITDFVAAGSFASLRENVVYKSEKDYAQLVRTTDLKSGFSKGSYVYVNEHAFEYLYRVNLDKECIILPNVGVNCGEVYYVTPSLLPYNNNVLGPNAVLVRSNKYNNHFLSYLFLGKDFQKKLSDITSHMAQPKFNKTGLKEIVISVPLLSEQQSIVETLDSLKSKVDRLQANYDKISQECDALKQAILRQVFE